MDGGALKNRGLAAPRPGAHRTPAERRFCSDERTPKVRFRLKRILSGEESMRAFVRRALPHVAEQEKAAQALRLVMAGFTFAHAGRECAVPTTTIVGWWGKFEDELRRWKAREENTEKKHGD